jgi:molecular chaperone HtpG
MANMEVKQFKAESKRLLDLMINSVYTHKEIFMRELISNASDAIDKLYYQALTGDRMGFGREDFGIEITADKDNRLLTVSDNGIGMTREELEENLGTIAQSGSLQFKKDSEVKEDIDIIGQFGVGFYSVFMVSEHVKVVSKAYGADQAYQWESDGSEGYTVSEAEKETPGTAVIMKIKPNTENEDYDEFLNSYQISGLVKKYSDYIRYPIQMDMEKSRLKEGSDKEYESYTARETLNSMVPLWRRRKEELTDEDYNRFYREKFFEYEDPLKIIHASVEGAATYQALLFIPGKTPYNYYTREYEKGLQLYSSGVLIMDKCPDLLPEHFRFVKGLVDSQDLSLNISREMLQHDRQLKSIASRLEKKIKSELSNMLENEREKYETFFKSFGLQLKYGVCADFGSHKDLLRDLLMFHSSSENKMVTVAEYIGRMKEDQKYIYYACGETPEKIALLPQTELVRDKGYEMLYLTDDVDEFVIQMLIDYDEKQFKSVNSDDLDIESEEEKKAAEQQTQEHQGLLDFVKDALGDKVKEVRLSKKLKSHPVCLSSDGALSLEMEKFLNTMPSDNKVKADRILEINASHKMFGALEESYEKDRDKAKSYAEILYNQALLIAGFTIEDPVAFSNMVCDLMG